MTKDESFICPQCGAEVPIKAKACPECGSDEKTGWSPDTYMDNIEIDMDEEEYDETVSKEFGSRKKPPVRQIAYALIGLIVLLMFLFGYLSGVL